MGIGGRNKTIRVNSCDSWRLFRLLPQILHRPPSSRFIYRARKEFRPRITRIRANRRSCLGEESFNNKYGANYAAVCDCSNKDRDVMLTFYDFPAEHWSHLRTTKAIESTSATIRRRHRRTKVSGTRRASLTMMLSPARS